MTQIILIKRGLKTFNKLKKIGEPYALPIQMAYHGQKPRRGAGRPFCSWREVSFKLW